MITCGDVSDGASVDCMVGVDEGTVNFERADGNVDGTLLEG